LTQQGLRLLEDSVEAGALSQTALAVPYGNLASMLNHQGDTVLAGRYAELASRSERDLGPKSDKQQLERPVLRR
jgi:hypothetical protein